MNLAFLVRSFNSMTTQLRDNRAQIDEFTRNLQQAVQELERRRQLMETVLENIPAGVIYLDSAVRFNGRTKHWSACSPARRKKCTRSRSWSV